jgi:hypothetical protein
MLPGIWPTPPASESGHIASTANPARQSTSAPTLIALRLRVLRTRAPTTANRSPSCQTEAPPHRTIEHVVDVAAGSHPQTLGHDGKLSRADNYCEKTPDPWYVGPIPTWQSFPIFPGRGRCWLLSAAERPGKIN